MRAGASVIPASDLGSKEDDLPQRKEFFDYVSVILRRDEGSWSLHAPRVGVDLMSCQPRCQVSQRNAVVGIRHTAEMPGAILSKRSWTRLRGQQWPRLPLLHSDGGLWRQAIATLAAPTDNLLRTIYKVVWPLSPGPPRTQNLRPGRFPRVVSLCLVMG